MLTRNMAINAKVILYKLPAHTTHRLQPCDVGAFGPLKREWNKRCQDVLDKTGEPVKDRDIVREYIKVRTTAFKAETIRQAFHRSKTQ